MVKFSRALVTMICGAARKLYPMEFIALLARGRNERGENREGTKEENDRADTIRELIILPLSVYGSNFSSIDFNMLPITSEAAGSVHSHPSPDNRPSGGDLLFFSRIRGVHAIICYPFSEKDMAVYDERGKPLDFEIAERKKRKGRD